MAVLAFDLGATKLATAVVTADGELLSEEKTLLAKRKGAAVGALIASQVEKNIAAQKEKGNQISSIGISVPGISHKSKGTVWAPNIPGWEEYPLHKEIKNSSGDIEVNIDSDRACYILGEAWQGVAKDCTDAIFLAVGTGIGAGIMVNGKVIRGANDIAGAIGWMALQKPFKENYKDCGCFEELSSGEGIAKMAGKILSENKNYTGLLKEMLPEQITATDIFKACEEGDIVAQEVVDRCIELWGMAIANLVSLFNPQKIILGGGVFGPAVKFIPNIRQEANKWAQPISMKQVSIEASFLGSRAGLYGAAFLALQNFKNTRPL